MAAELRVEILTFAGCPNGEPARTLVGEVARELGCEPVVDSVLVEDPDRAASLRFLGSPTIRVNGHDVEPGADERRRYALSCRVYTTPEGTHGLPPRDWVRAALERASG